ncbi:MAG: hypothetical protein ACTSRR_08975 [Candidatus Heimdallarchaeaceae archaeon]
MFTKTKIIGLGILLSMLISSLAISAESQGLQYSEQNKLVTISYEDFTLMVNAGGQVPKFHIIQDGGIEFQVMFKLLAEYYDENGDGAFQYDELNIAQTGQTGPPTARTNILALPSVIWSFSGFEAEYEEGTENIVAIHFSFVSDQILIPFYADFSMEIKAHFYLDNKTIDGYEIIGGRELKFDIIMNNWPWERDDTYLALRFDISPQNDVAEVKDAEGKPIDTKTNSTGAEHKVNNQNKMKNSFELGNATDKGFFAYSNKANYSYQNEYQQGTVNCSYATNGDNTIQTYLSFEHFDEEVVYDPSLGIVSDTEEDTEGDTDEDTSGLGNIEILTISVFSISAITAVAIIRKKK